MAEGLLDQYREKLKKAIGTARFYGLPDRPLEKVFVELTVIEDFEIPRDAEYKALMDKELRRRRTLFPKDETEEGEEDNPEETDKEDRKRPRKVRGTVKPEELLEAGKRSQIVGAPGCGKTTLLRWLALQIAQTSDRLPVFIELKALKKAQFDTIDEDFSVFLFQQGVRKRFDRTDLTSEQFTVLETVFCEHYKNGRLVVLLDGLDEIAESERHRLRTAVENYANHHEGGLTLIISTRPYGYLRNFADLKAMEIEPLSDIQIGQFLDHWCEKQTAETVKANLRKNSNLRSLARFPFLLAFITHLNSAGDIPRIELYQKIVSELIVKLDKDKGVERFKIDDPSGVLKHGFLKRFAFSQLFENQQAEVSTRLVFSTEDLLKAAKTFLREEEPTIAPHHLVHDVCATPLLREVEGDRYAFVHLTIQEFLAAEELSKHNNCDKFFAKAFFSRRLVEQEVLPMFFGLLKNPKTYLEKLSRLPESFEFSQQRLITRSLGYIPKKSITFRNLVNVYIKDFITRTEQHNTPFRKMFFKEIATNELIYREYFLKFLLNFETSDNYEKTRVIQAIGEIAEKQKEINYLKKFLEIPMTEDRGLSDHKREALIAISKIVRSNQALSTPENLNLLLKALDDSNSYIRKEAVKQLGYWANNSDLISRKCISKKLLEILAKDVNTHVQSQTAFTFRKIIFLPEEVPGKLIDCLEDMILSEKPYISFVQKELLKTLDAIYETKNKALIKVVAKYYNDDKMDIHPRHFAGKILLNFNLISQDDFLKLEKDYIASQQSQSSELNIEKLLSGNRWERKIEARKISNISENNFKNLLTKKLDPSLNQHIWFPTFLKCAGYYFDDQIFFQFLEKISLDENSSRSIKEVAKDSLEKYKFKLEMLGLLPA